MSSWRLGPAPGPAAAVSVALTTACRQVRPRAAPRRDVHAWFVRAVESRYIVGYTAGHIVSRCVSSVAVVPELASRDKWAAIHEVISQWPALSGRYREEIERAVIARERIHSTAVGRGIALSHGELQGLSSLLVAVGVSRVGIEFGAVDRRPVHLLFVFATPPAQRSEYLQTLAAICRLARQGRLTALWEAAADTDTIERTLSRAFEPLN